MAAVERSGKERLVTGYSGRLSVVLAAGVLTVNLGRQALPPLLPAIIDDFSITAAEAGFLLTVLWGLYALLQYPAGRFSDELSRKTALVFGLGVTVVGFVLLVGAPGYPAALAAAALVGGGAAFYMLSVRTLLSDLFVARRGQAFGLNIAIGQVGSVLAAGLAVAALAVATWRAAFLPVAALLCVVGIALHRSSREPYRVGRVPLGVRETVARVFGDRTLRRLVVAYTLVILTWQGVVGFLPVFLQVEKGFSTAFAGGGFAAVFVVGILVQPFAGGLSDRTARIPVAGGAAVLSAVGLIVLIAAPSQPVVIAGVVVFAAGLMGFPPVMQAYLMDVFPDDSRGGDLGAFKTVYEGLGSAGPTYVGVVGGTAGYAVAFGGFVACLLACAAIVFWSASRGE